MAQFVGYNGVSKVVALSDEQLKKGEVLKAEEEAMDKAARAARSAYTEFYNGLAGKDYDWYLDETRQFLLLRKRGMV